MAQGSSPAGRERPLSLIVAWDEARGIGKDGDLPWQYSEDLRHFKRLTLGHALLMGRLCFESIGRPLPGRTNLVVSRTPDFAPEGVQVFRTWEAMREAAYAVDRAPMVIGGAAIYGLALPDVTHMIVTEVPGTHDADVVFPDFDERQFAESPSEVLPPPPDVEREGLRVRYLHRRSEAIDEFWRWFRANAEVLSRYGDAASGAVLSELDARILALEPRAGWEIGPAAEGEGGCIFVISPNRDPALRVPCQRIVAWAPELPGWSFHDVRPAKSEGRMYLAALMQAEGQSFADCRDWHYCFHRGKGGIQHLEFFPPLGWTHGADDTQAFAVVLAESVLGEATLIGGAKPMEISVATRAQMPDAAGAISYLRPHARRLGIFRGEIVD